MSGLGSPAMRLLDIMGMLNALLFALLPFFMARPWWREKMPSSGKHGVPVTCLVWVERARL
jgi:hypothetical protein